jgi:hypothetical protein
MTLPSEKKESQAQESSKNNSNADADADPDFCRFSETAGLGWLEGEFVGEDSVDYYYY